ncbi:tRNA (N6-threonylcarbamoyladenosine(37)-N6)-methyltransferase TrmO [Psychrobacter sp. Ps3]|jgi:tRNA-Thr(GGU) m(6)t(6)A37 methyltransferase TsaA|uniref:tRNA (N6-threonylcarbamoyladenosine(37)-N6)-methyltransferase TrmO n=1 Tax=Psychrobacter sp. Ps3 TaxID=2790957 RepID=UPI001EDE2B09|nr:tRNA (N6-threonylcarbamoyladenosine(37)-N6)-methyltransferase TrmO [Psychrobacter sp. Ps3]MCG3882028.1 tRNA (N6-threonylcarbamoyladenosine(37)-N6)-methyltransferase TrmO [Psychrobacter sp. Ps3]
MSKQIQTHMSPIIGYHRAPLSQKFGAPRQPNLVALMSAIEMIAPFDTPAAFVGLEGFSHLWLSWQFHHNKDTYNSQSFRPQVRPPRLGGNQKIGVFASRSMYRPSQMGLSVVKLERIDVVAGRVILIISGADIIDATPIIDIKPYIAYSDSIEHATSGFAPAAPTPSAVTMTVNAQEQFAVLVDSDIKSRVPISSKSVIEDIQQRLVATDLPLIKALIAQDPRPAYRRNEINTSFTMRYKTVDVSFCQVATGELQISSVVEVV